MEDEAPRRRSTDRPGMDPWGLLEAFANQREERRVEMDAMEHRITGRLAEFKADVDQYISAHMTVHEALLKESELFKGKFLDMELASAEKRGRTFFVLKFVQIIGREWRLIGMALLALLTFLGNVQIRIAAS